MLKHVECPYCGKTFDTPVDESAGSQEYIEDCPVCCRPIELQVEIGLNDGAVSITVRRDDD